MSRATFARLVGSLPVVFVAACTTPEKSNTDLRQPGPAIGAAVGTAAGAVAGNVAGAGVAATQAAGNAFAAPFTNEHHIVRTWRTERTADGRTIQVPVDTEVDEYGRPVKR
jgi:hypothetical protein